MDPREGTSRSPPGQRDRFPSEGQGGSPGPLVPASPAPIEARGDVVPPASPVPLGMREVVQLLTRMVSIHERQLKSGVDIQRDRSESLKDFIDHLYRVLRVMHASVTKAVELASFQLRDVAILWYEAWERSRGPDVPPEEWEDFSEAILAHYLPREVREARLD
ncbi:hypothetical protein KY285_012661 [Solanum tuberosum]|nr:hypothetical protein KY285_012661 [Solanum tuberosum]